MIKYLRIQIIVLIGILFTIPTFAYDFEKDGICYNILKNKTNEVEITRKSFSTSSPTYYTGELNIPSSVTYNGITYTITAIGEYAFERCKDLTGSINIPQSVTYIGKNAFHGCKNLTGSLIIPNSVTEIGAEAFMYCSGLNGELKLPNSITEIKDNTFYECSSLSGDLTIPDGVTSIGEAAFYKCSGFTGSLTIPSSVLYLGGNAFTLCKGLIGTLEIPSSLISIGRYTFYCCEGLTGSLTIPSSVTSIGEYAFWGCRFTGTLTIPSSTTSIEKWAFSFCTGIESLTIPLSVHTIGDHAFYGCSNLSMVRSYIELPFYISEDVFYHISSNAILQVPEGTKNKYQIYSGWIKNFGNIVEEGNAPTTKYTLSISSTGNGFVSYDGNTIRSKTSTFTVNEGANANISFSADNGYRIKSVKVNSSDVKSSVSNNQYTVDNIQSNIFVEVEFEINSLLKEAEEKLSETTKRIDNTQSKLDEFNNALKKSTIDDSSKMEFESSLSSFHALIAALKAQMAAIAAHYYYGATDRELTVLLTQLDDVNSQLDEINKSINEEYEKFISISNKTYILSIKVTGNGSASYDGNTIRSKTSTFTLNGGSSATISFSPDNGYRVKSVKVNSSDVTSSLSNNKYTISNINKNTSVEVEFQEELKTFTSGNLNYAVLSYDDKTVSLANGKYGTVLEVPATITYQDITWKVAGIDNAALANNEELAAIIWNPSAAFTVSVSNPNLLLYVKSASYAPATIKNVVVNSTAEDIVLTDAASGNNFYCPKEFTAKKISYTHNYGMITGLGECRGWETIALPFDVKKIAHSSKGELTPFASWKSGDSKKPFWLMSYGTGGWTNANSIKANTPYIISMPNNQDYKAEFRLSGNITFSSENVTVKKSDNLQTGSYDGNTFTPNYSNGDNSAYLALNVNNDYVSYSGGSAEGSTFVVNLRPVHPFEAYMTSTSKTRSTISINGDMATGIEDISVLMDESKGLRIYDLKGQLIKVEQEKSLDEVRRYLPSGVYIVNGKKLIIK